MRETRKEYLAVFACVVAGIFLACAPFFLNLYWLRNLTNIFMFAIIAQGINIIAGYTGYPAFGNVVFFGLGAYSTGVLMVKFQTAFLTSVLAGMGICLLFTLLFGVPLLRLKGHYFAIATLGLNEATRAIVDNLSDLTGGGMGLSLPLPAGDIDANSRYFYFMLYGTMVLSIIVTYLLSKSRFGYACRTIRSDEDGAEGMGINTTRYKTLAWMISAVFTGVAGSVYAYWMSYIEPAAVFDMMIAIKSFVMFLLGGAGTVLGPALGAFFLEAVSTLTWSHLLNYHVGTLGVIIILVVIFMPRGFITFLYHEFSLSGMLRRLIKRKRPTPQPEMITMGGSNPDNRMLDLNGLGSGYKPLQVLWDVELFLQEGEWLALLGSNGAGKSTLLKTIAGLLKPFHGEIRYQGRALNVLPVHERLELGIALVPEGRRLFAGMTVRENLMMGAFAKNRNGRNTEQLQRVFDLFPILKQRQKQIVGTLSGGERQMCAIGRALMSRPKLLLVDELSLGLAPVVIDGLLEALVAIKQEGVTLMVVEQDVNTALVYADRGYVLREGRIVKSGAAKQLLADPTIQKDYLGTWEGE
jgi:branched-chain amino acid transport system permease protein